MFFFSLEYNLYLVYRVERKIMNCFAGWALGYLIEL